MGRILPFFILIAAVGLFFGYVQPTYKEEIAAQRAKIRSYDSALAAAATFREKREALIEQQNAIPQSDRTRIEGFLPDGVDNVQLIVDLNALASRSGMRLSDFNIAEAEESQGVEPGRIALDAVQAVDSLEISVTAVGTYGSFRTFLAGVEHSLRPMDLVDLQISDSETGVYNYAMTFRIYWLR